VAYGDGGLWVVDSVAHDLFEIDPATDSLKLTVPLDMQPSALLIGAEGIWVAGYANATVEKLDPNSGRVIGRVPVGNGPTAVVAGAGSLWVANSLDSTVSRIDPSKLTVTATVAVGSGPTALADAGGEVWVANQYSGTISRIDPRRAQEVGSIRVGGDPTGLAVSGPRVWVSVAADTSTHRGGTLTMVTPSVLASSSPDSLGTIDPAFFHGANTAQFMGLAYDSLVNVQQSPGADGLRLVPDLALSLPTPTDGGKVYTFQLRPGIRYSDGQLVRASDFRRTFERLFRVSSPAVSSLQDFVGAGPCTRSPGTCDLAQGIVTNDATGTITFHLTAPSPGFLYGFTEGAFTAPIPPGTPDHETGQNSVPGTGPYEIASISADEIRFVRNPFFREWSHAAKPDGYPDSIVWRTVASDEAAVTEIEQGRADWLLGSIPVSQFDQLELQDPSIVHSNPAFSVDFLPINTHLAPFNDLRVRQALNYAVDRAKIVSMYGGPSFATPTCQLIMPGLPGYSAYCPYTTDPSPDGAYHGPDMATARRLVAQSGTEGDRIDIWGDPNEGTVPPTVLTYVAGLLSSLGYQVHVHDFTSANATPAFWDSIQLSDDGDISTGPYPSTFIPLFTSCGGSFSNGYYCNPALDRQMQEAGQLEGTDLGAASTLWASIDRQLTDAAVWLPTVNLRDVEIVSNRMSNYEYGPIDGFLADQAWLK
jgi:YVTN family beta-propeller protein